MKKKLAPDDYYLHLAQLMAALPESPHDPDLSRWLGRVHAVMMAGGNLLEAVEVKLASPSAVSTNMKNHTDGMNRIAAALHRAFAAAEIDASVPIQGAVIPIGATHDAFVAVSQAIGEAKKDVLIVDRYMSEHVLEYALAVPERIPVRLLVGRKDRKPALAPAAAAWTRQHKENRPLSIRNADDYLLHDRLLLVDGTQAWSVTQSFNGLASRSPASILRFPTPQMTAQKVESYEEIWTGSTEG